MGDQEWELSTFRVARFLVSKLANPNSKATRLSADTFNAPCSSIWSVAAVSHGSVSLSVISVFS